MKFFHRTFQKPYHLEKKQYKTWFPPAFEISVVNQLCKICTFLDFSANCVIWYRVGRWSLELRPPELRGCLLFLETNGKTARSRRFPSQRRSRWRVSRGPRQPRNRRATSVLFDGLCQLSSQLWFFPFSYVGRNDDNDCLN